MTKEEKLNYLKNKISMELKNPDTQQGFEIICKRFSELEQELERTKEEKYFFKKDVQELEKENAELKAENKTILEDNDTLNEWVDELKAQIEKMKTCSRCMSNNKDIEEYPCKDCFKDGVYTKWH